MGLLSFSKLFLIIAWFRAQGLGSTYSVSQPPPPFGAPPSRGRRENAGFPASSFRANARNLFRPLFPRPFAKPFRGSTASVLPRYGVSRSLLSNTLRLTANEKDPSAALGMTKRGNVSSLFSFRYGSQPPPLRGTSFQRKEGECRRNRAAIPRASPSGRPFAGEGGRMPSFRIVISSESEKSFSFAVR